jgi:hypothetical protein
MALRLVNSSVVVVAHNFNPSVTNQVWLTDHDIVHRDEYQPGAVFTDMFVQVPARGFHLLIVPEQCQFTLSAETERQQELVIERIGTLVRTLPHTPYHALGLNFVWQLVPEGETVEELSRRLFFVATSAVHRMCDSDDTKFGAYLSKDSLGCRLKLDIKPVRVQSPEEGEVDLLQFGFNYHHDIGNREDPVPEIEETLNRWDEARDQSSQIAHAATRGREP